jgi:lipopolysaccharide export LptBFGC system permease protein LptF
MPESRSRKGHNYQKPSDVPAAVRTKGRITWGILLAVFALIVCYFAVGSRPEYLIIFAVAGFILGMFLGRAMEKDASNK